VIIHCQHTLPIWLSVIVCMCIYVYICVLHISQFRNFSATFFSPRRWISKARNSQCVYRYESYINLFGSIHLDTVQMPTATHSDRCLEAFHCSSTVSGWWAIESCPFKRYSIFFTFYPLNCYGAIWRHQMKCIYFFLYNLLQNSIHMLICMHICISNVNFFLKYVSRYQWNFFANKKYKYI